MVTKFQRVVPIMNVRSKDKKKVVRYDPSKHCHQIKRLDAEKKNSSTEVGCALVKRNATVVKEMQLSCIALWVFLLLWVLEGKTKHTEP